MAYCYVWVKIEVPHGYILMSLAQSNVVNLQLTCSSIAHDRDLLSGKNPGNPGVTHSQQ